MALTEHSNDYLPTRFVTAQDQCVEDRGLCQLHGDDIAAMQASHVAEVAALRRRIEVLETTLAAADDAARDSVFADTAPPAVTTITVHPGAAPAEAPHAVIPHPAVAVAAEQVQPMDLVENADGATAWDDGEASFAERVAALAFFREDVDQPARRWLLKDV